MPTILNISKGCTVHTNGKTYENIQGQMTITDEGVFVNGKPVEEYKEPVIVKLSVHGHVESITADGDIFVDGDVKDASTRNGNIIVKGNVTGNAETRNGNITVAGSVHGDATTRSGRIL